MNWELHPKMNEKLYLRNPEQSEIGKNMIKKSINLIRKLGFEAFTFKKLAEEIPTTEATVYRYFENKHRLLSYVVAWYWHWLDYQVMFKTNNLKSSAEKIKVINQILTWQMDEEHTVIDDISLEDLHQIIIYESSKVYLTKHVTEDNQYQLFKPYKNLCARISNIFKDFNPDYPYTRSLASTIIEMAHFQDFFMTHLPALTDFAETKSLKNVNDFLNSLVFSALEKKVKATSN
ncbi:MAG: TetR/AcrR family transcriptional regulator [Bacteroidetes bacterium]|nr:TetR/AcrR family transcriptional regulator [Bacteroidota bacterium]MBU1373575.1 TetR/AcrR family transcriptional regulator [Bacteroidota bacterium]MBU1486386.1 TetR/AcrR family transcriptional regulator [Bacteroidota bacterium]MBU1759263.1 TetR/AcrR family transcriptional regulator [Bacteroidota bacterium]MBU2268279.1 TetR/AcrR family transcriptional regulator [Bacteroidota bacterium]